ncbi:MAG TPA: L,D-transpeptidase family protein [Gemmatimonadaceae bacterium]|nr:L,D-transpeptidase family protein [Gemmatimonadaceae bacterium]
MARWAPPDPNTIKGVPLTAVQEAITTRLAAARPKPISHDSWDHVQHLYQLFARGPLWLDRKGLNGDRTHALTDELLAIDSDAVAVDAYPLADLARAIVTVRDSDHPTAEQLAEVDVLLTTCFAALGEDLITGQISPGSVSQSWHISSREDDVDSALVRTLRVGDLQASMSRMRPQDPEYDALRKELGRYRELVARGGWPQVPDGPSLKPGDTTSIARVTALRARLAAEGLVSAAPTSSGVTVPEAKAVYDSALAGAVAEFQVRHAIGVDSILGGETLASLNLSASYRLGQIAANLERYRWLPRLLGDRYVLVNVPAFHLTAFDGGKPALDMKVIVGAEYNNRSTPVFSDSMEYVVFRPYWIVPTSIAEKEIWPKVQQDPTYLDRNDYEQVTIDGEQRIRQKPGPRNSLGLVKFIFPNDFSIYLHATPQNELFDKDVRAMSHGCIRLQHPAEFAEWVLGWPMDRVEQEMQSGPDDHRVNLPHKVPVYIVYFTTYTQNGELYFGNDLYKRDDALVKAVADGAQLTAEESAALAVLRKAAAS